jgi:O-antigen biosynthesis protein
VTTVSQSGQGYAAAWLSDELLLVAGPGGSAEVGVSFADGAVSVETHEASQPADRNGRLPSVGVRVLVVRLPASLDRAGEDVELEIDGSRLSLPAGGAAWNDVELSALVRERLAGLGPEARENLVEFIARACAPNLEGPGRAALADRLRLIRDSLRERLPLGEIREGEPRALALDDILAIDDRSFWIKGWVWDVDVPSPRVEVLSPEGARIDVLENAFRWRRRDIEQLYNGFGVPRSLNGFVAYPTLPLPSRASSGWIARLRLPGGDGIETSGPDVVRSPVTVRDLILRDLSWTDRDRERMVADYAYPALSRVLERMASSVEVDQTFQFGDPPEDPGTSIVVSLAGQVNAIDHHLIQFRTDPDVCGADLIYLVDTAEAADELVTRLAELHWLYPVPFRLVTLTAKAGPTVMDAVGVSMARASRLVFLSPDVMPDRPGWLSAMGSFYDSQPRIGALGPRLIYEDGSLQHAGLGFELVSPQEFGLAGSASGTWQARSFFKGLPQDFDGATDSRAVPAVSGACMMIDRELFESVGGLRNVYVDGEYEDVDLCLRIAAAGRENWYTADATLYHLEGRSRAVPEPTARQYNILLQTHLWRDRIEAG